jgi:hypothetical protein
MTIFEEKFVRVRHWFLAAIILMTLGILYMGLAPAAEAPLPTEWRALAFTYSHSKYERVVDMFDTPFPDQATCLASATQGMREVAEKLKDGEGIVATCIQVPVLKPSVTS